MGIGIDIDMDMNMDLDGYENGIWNWNKDDRKI